MVAVAVASVTGAFPLPGTPSLLLLLLRALALPFVLANKSSTVLRVSKPASAARIVAKNASTVRREIAKNASAVSRVAKMASAVQNGWQYHAHMET